MARMSSPTVAKPPKVRKHRQGGPAKTKARWTKEEDAHLLSMLKQSEGKKRNSPAYLSWQQIAKQLGTGRTELAVQQHSMK